jgi:hypothetical protein
MRFPAEPGSVPELLVKNLAKAPVLILDSEEPVGAKQRTTVRQVQGRGMVASICLSSLQT